MKNIRIYLRKYSLLIITACSLPISPCPKNTPGHFLILSEQVNQNATFAISQLQYRCSNRQL